MTDPSRHSNSCGPCRACPWCGLSILVFTSSQFPGLTILNFESFSLHVYVRTHTCTHTYTHTTHTPQLPGLELLSFFLSLKHTLYLLNKTLIFRSRAIQTHRRKEGSSFLTISYLKEPEQQAQWLTLLHRYGQFISFISGF